MVEPLSQIYSELWRLQIHKFAPFLQVALKLAYNTSELEGQHYGNQSCLEILIFFSDI